MKWVTAAVGALAIWISIMVGVTIYTNAIGNLIIVHWKIIISMDDKEHYSLYILMKKIIIPGIMINVGPPHIHFLSNGDISLVCGLFYSIYSIRFFVFDNNIV